jgi:hypothetical protein
LRQLPRVFAWWALTVLHVEGHAFAIPFAQVQVPLRKEECCAKDIKCIVKWHLPSRAASMPSWCIMSLRLLWPWPGGRILHGFFFFSAPFVSLSVLLLLFSINALFV